VVAVEEHFRAPTVNALATRDGFGLAMGEANPKAQRSAMLDDAGEDGLAEMHAAGIDLRCQPLR